MSDHAFPVHAPTMVLRSAGKASVVPATGLPACAPLGPVIDRELAMCRRNGSSLVVMSIGLDHFESVGQRHGDEVATQVLQALWNRFRNHLRGSDLAVRVGPSEFGAVLVNAGWPAAAIVDARLSDALTQPYGIGPLEIVVSARTGAAVYPRAGSSGDALLNAAIQARDLKLRT
jgi:diguanylate cyclase (GGDEF)-like protein